MTRNDAQTPAPARYRSRDTVKRKLASTLYEAQEAYDCSWKIANLTGWGLTAILFAQIIVGALITLLSAIASNRGTQIGTAVLGAVSTVISGYLAKVRHQDEPAKSLRRHTELGCFIRALNNYIDDFGNDDPADHMADVNAFREQLERILSMPADKNAPDTQAHVNSAPPPSNTVTQSQNGSKPKGSMDKSTLSGDSLEVPTPPPATLRKVGKFMKVGTTPPRYNDSQV